MKHIELTQGKYAIVDDEDFEWLGQWKWYFYKHKHTFYVKRYLHSKGKNKIIYMHRQILNAQKNDITDHINRNGLDNRRSNLRVCTHQQNCRNRMPTGKTSEYKGVSYNSQMRKWLAQICYEKKRKSTHIGYYTVEIEAAKAYDARALEMFGEFAYCNFK